MPIVNRQKPVAAPGQVRKPVPQADGVLARIKPVILSMSGIKLSLYGRGKTGKTRLACTFPGPVLVIGTEDGTKSVAGTKDLDFVRLNQSDEIQDLVNMLRDDSPQNDRRYRSIVLDTAGGMQDLITKEVLGLSDVPTQRSWGMATQQVWGAIAVQTKDRLSSLLRLADTHNLNVVIIAHERNFNDDVASEVMVPTVGSALTPSASGWLATAVDYIGQCYIREQTVLRVSESGDKERHLTGKKEYCLRVGPHPVYQSGFRLPPGFYLPDNIVNPSYAKVAQIIRGEYKDPAKKEV